MDFPVTFAVVLNLHLPKLRKLVLPERKAESMPKVPVNEHRYS
jgi:hypothetical protein